jgi:glycosyltransferase involved in cell wall biosynthesis
MSPRRILVVAPLYHPDRGGLGRQAVLLTERLADLGVHLEVATRLMRGLPDYHFRPGVLVHRIAAGRPRVHNYETPNLENLFTSLAFSLGLVLLLLRRRRFDAIHVHGASLPLLVILPFAKLLRIPVLALVAATHQGVEAGDMLRHRVFGHLLARAFAKVDGYVAITAEVEQLLVAEGVPPERIARIPFFVDVEHFKPFTPEERARARAELGLEGKTVVVASGRLVPRKGGDTLIRAFAQAAKEAPETAPLLVFLGDGPERATLEALASAEAPGGSVRFAGFVEDVPRWLGASDVLVLASRIEGLPNALLEALGMGLACIATRIAGAEEVIDDGRTGLLVPPGAEDALAHALASLLRDPAYRRQIGEAASGLVRARLARDVIVPRYLEVFEELMEGRGIARRPESASLELRVLPRLEPAPRAAPAPAAAPPGPGPPRGREGPEISIVMPVYEARETVAKALACVLGQKTARSFEVVAVDDGSRDGSFEAAAAVAAREPRVRVLRKENGGEASALNVGFREAKGRFLAIVEADVELEPGWLETALGVLEAEPGAVAVGGYLETPREDSWIARLAGYEVERKFATKPRDAKHLTSANVLYRREAWEIAGPFDEKLVNASLDSVFNGKLVKAGKRLVYEPRARCRHHYKTTLAGFLRRQWSYARYRVYNEVLDLYPADRFLAVHVAVAGLALAALVLGPALATWAERSQQWAFYGLGPALLGLALALELPAALSVLARTKDLAALAYPPVLVLRNLIGALGYATGLVAKGLEGRAGHTRVGLGRSPRVLVVAPLYHTERGGQGRQAVLLAERLGASGMTLEVATRRMRGLPPRHFSPEVKIHKLPAPQPSVHNYEKVSLENFSTSLAFSLGLVKLLATRRSRIDLVHVHGASLPLLIILPFAKALGVPVLAKVAATKQGVEAGDMRQRYGPLGRLLAWLFARVDGYIATTAEIARVLEHDGVARERIARVPNFVDVTSFKPLSPGEREAARRELGIEGRTVLVASGRLAARKANDVLLRAYARALPGAKGVHPLLVFLGDGPERKRLEQLAVELGIADDVRFEGFVDDVPRWLGAADALALASRIEGLPNALLEGLASGLACVGTRIGGGEEAIQDGKNGILVPPDDERALALALERVLSDEALRRRLGEAAARGIRERFALDAVAPRYVAIYRELSA